MKKGVFFEQLVTYIQVHHKDSPNTIIMPNAIIEDCIGIKREIDVLVTSFAYSSKKMIAYECKDHHRPVGIEVVDAFVGKCSEIPQITDKILVSSSGFTNQARISAMHRGVHLASIKNIKSENVFINLDVFTPKVSYKLIGLDWDVVFKNDISGAIIKQPATLKNFIDDKKINLDKRLYHIIYKTNLLSKLCSEFINNEKKPFDTIIPLPTRNRIYLEDIYGNKQAIRFLNIPVQINIDLNTMDICFQKQYSCDYANTLTTITGYKDKKANRQMVAFETDNKVTMCLRNKNNKLIEPTDVSEV